MREEGGGRMSPNGSLGFMYETVACPMRWNYVDEFGINCVGFCHLNIGPGLST